MTSLSLDTTFTLSGQAVGVPANGVLNSGINVSSTAAFTSSGTGATLMDNVIDEATEEQSLSAGGTVAIDLTSFINVLNQTSQAMTAVRTLYVLHSDTSLASSITVFNAGAGSSFQGPLSPGASITLAPGEDFPFRSATATGIVVAAGNKNFSIVNNDGANAATLRYFIGGS